MIDNGIGVEGVKSMNETLQVNTTLTSLNIEGEERKQEYQLMNKRMLTT